MSIVCVGKGDWQINNKKLKFSVDYKVYLVLILKISVNVGLLIEKYS
jgi:hypothetical protein